MLIYMCEYVEPNLGNEKYMNRCTNMGAITLIKVTQSVISVCDFMFLCSKLLN